MNGIFLGNINIIPRLKTNVVNLIYAPVGSGKSTWVKDHLIKSVSDKREVLYLTDTTAGRDQALSDCPQDLTVYTKEWYRMMNGIYAPFAWGNYENFPEDSVPIMTYSKMAHLIKGNGSKFGVGYLKYIVLDECHNLKIYQSFDKGKNSVLKLLEIWIKNVLRQTDIKVIVLTATPRKVYTMFDPKIVNIILSDAEKKSLRTLKDIKTKKYASIQNLFSNLPSGRGVIYTSHIRTMKKYAELIGKFDNKRKTELIWSRNNEKYPLDNRQWDIWNSILQHGKIPDETEILMYNASCQCGININTPVDFAIIDEWDEDTIIQARGRIRNDLPLLYLPSKTPDYFYLPSDLLGVKIYQEDKHKIVDYINLRNDGHLKGWNTIDDLIRESNTYCFDLTETGKDYFRDYGYIVDGKKKDRRYHVIKLNA